MIEAHFFMKWRKCYNFWTLLIVLSTKLCTVFVKKWEDLLSRKVHKNIHHAQEELTVSGIFGSSRWYLQTPLNTTEC